MVAQTMNKTSRTSPSSPRRKTKFQSKFTTRLFLVAIVALSSAKPPPAGFNEPDQTPYQQEANEKARQAQNAQTGAVATHNAAITYIKPITQSKVDDTANCMWVADASCRLKELDFTKDPIAYHNQFEAVMSALGWTMGEGQFSTYSSTDAKVTMDVAVIEILLETIGTAGAGAAVAVVSTLNALKKQSKDGKITLFQMSNKDENRGNFIIGYAMEDDFGYVSTCTTAFSFTSSTRSGGALFWSWKVDDTSMKYQMTRRQLNNTVFKLSGQHIVERMMKAHGTTNVIEKQLSSEEVADANKDPNKKMDDLLGLGEDTPVPPQKLGASMASDTDDNQLLYGSAPATKTQKRNRRRRALKSKTAPAQSSTGFCLSTASAECIEELKRVNAYVEQRLAVRARARENVDDKHKFISAHRDYEDVERPRAFLSRDDGYHAFYTPAQQMRLGVDACGYSTSEGFEDW